LYHNAIPGVFETLSNWARRLITGNISLYVLYGVVGILITLLLLVVL
jgi:NADH-quinone oxidoreductase subunit L